MKQCSKCFKWKEESEFKKDPRVKSGLQAECKEHAKERRDRNHEMYRETERKRELKKYGLTLEDFNSMLRKQNNCCKICKRPDGEMKRQLHVDHDHKTGKVRALLCSHCNTALGKVADSILTLFKMILYLIRHRS